MIEREKVIKAIECCVVNHTRCFDDKDKLCPYFTTKVYMCETELLKDALAMLKKQEAVEPMIKTSHDGKGTWWYICGSCNTAVNPKDKYCRECGRGLKWNEGPV